MDTQIPVVRAPLKKVSIEYIQVSNSYLFQGLKFSNSKKRSY